MPLLGKGEGEETLRKRDHRDADARLKSQPGPPLLFTLVSKWVFQPQEGKCSDRARLVAVSQGPSQALASPGAGGSLLPTRLASAAGCYQEPQGRRGLAVHANALQMTRGHGVLLQSPVAVLLPFDLAIFWVFAISRSTVQGRQACRARSA